jgi:hypothetical protein
MILLLEDDPDRLRRFAAVLNQIAPALEVRTWRSARLMLAELPDCLTAARLISLDHDLSPWEGDHDDPGDGVEVVKFLVTHAQPCPVIIHSSNRERSDWMAGDLELAGWNYRRVAPLGEDWIEAYWAAVARRCLSFKGSRRSRHSPRSE